MYEYKAPLRDIQFVLYELWDAEQAWSEIPAYADVNRELVDAILEEGAKVTEGSLAPLNRSGDEQGVEWKNGEVSTPEGFKEAWNVYAPGGWVGLIGNPEYQGQGMPKMLSAGFEEMLHAANVSFCLYSILSTGASLAIDAHASEELKQTYLPRLYSGEWCGVMALTEAHSGTDLGVMRTRAEPAADGSYRISGSKIFITGGEHDLTENIIHLVLAKLPDAPAGSKGISLFLVPKRKVNADGSLGDANNVTCASVEHKMGIHASSTCVMNYDAATGYLVGDENGGLAAMFTMMNYERVSMGLQGIGCAELALQKSRGYARDRLQGRAASGVVNAESYADPIIHHADVRRMLLTQKAYTEAARALAAYVGLRLDRAKHLQGEAQKHAADMVALMTPLVKAFMTDRALECCVLGQQVFGGHGYIREWGMEQLVRDARIAQIYEGTNGIQALDLMGRKIGRSGGALLEPFLLEIEQFVSEHPDLVEFIGPLTSAVSELRDTARLVVENSADSPDEIGAASVDFTNAFGMLAYAYMWAAMAAIAVEKKDGDDAEFYAAKLATARFYYQRLLPLFNAYIASVRAGAAVMMDMPADWV